MKLKAMVLIMVLGSGMGTGAAMQKGIVLPSSEPFSLPDIPGQPPMADEGRRRLEMQRLKSANAERQKQMTRDAVQLLNLAGELQFKAQQNDGATSQAEMLHQLEVIEKLAHNVKERMKGSR